MSEKTNYGPRASLAELKEFCNKVRAAGGGEALGSLLPSTPRSASTCLIAKNLNFGCSVRTAPWENPVSQTKYPSGEAKWYMFVQDAETRGRIAGVLGLELVRFSVTGDVGLLLPVEIGRTAAAYDEWWTRDAVRHDRKGSYSEVTIDLTSEFGALVEPAHIRSYTEAVGYKRITILR